MAASDFDNLAADLSAYLDGELDAPRAAAMEELLSRSADARRTLADLRMVRDGLRALPRVAAPRELASDVIAQALARQSSSARRRNAWRVVVQITGLAAGAAGFMYLGARFAAPPIHSDGPIRHFSSSAEHGRAAEPPAGEVAERGSVESPKPGILADSGARRGIEPATEPVARDELRVAFGGEAPRSPDAPAAASQPFVALVTPDSLVTGTGTMTYRVQDVQLGMPLALENSPTVRVVVASRSQAEYDAASRLLAAYEARSDELVQRKLSNDAFQRGQTPQAAGAVGDDAVVGPELPTQILGCSEASPRLVSDICAELNRVAPSQVSVALEFRGPQLQNMHAVAQQIQPAADSESDAALQAWVGESAAVAAMKKDAAGFTRAPVAPAAEPARTNEPAATTGSARPSAEAKSEPTATPAEREAEKDALRDTTHDASGEPERTRRMKEAQPESGEAPRAAAPAVGGRGRTAGGGGAAASSPAGDERAALAPGGRRDAPGSDASQPAPQAPPVAGRMMDARRNADDAATREAELSDRQYRQVPSRGVITRALVSQIDRLGRRVDETMQQINRNLIEQNAPPPGGPPVSLNVILLPPPPAPASSRSAPPR